MSHSRGKTHLAIRLVRRGAFHFAVVSFSSRNRSRAGRGSDREAAIADALHRSRVFYSDAGVERDVVFAEARNEKVNLVLVGDTLYQQETHAESHNG